jgi:hypothetical protein
MKDAKFHSVFSLAHNALIKELKEVEYNLCIDKYFAGLYWAGADKSKPVATGYYFERYKEVKERIAFGKDKARRLRYAIRVMKLSKSAAGIVDNENSVLQS